MPVIWSNTDYPYECLKDRERTEAFRDALRSVVQTGDVVVDGGSGTGILALFAAEAGAKKVYLLWQVNFCNVSSYHLYDLFHMI